MHKTKHPLQVWFRNAPLKIKITIDGSGNTALIGKISKEITDTAKEVHVELANYLTLHMPTSGLNITGGWFAAAGLMLLAAATIGLFGLKISRLKKQKK